MYTILANVVEAFFWMSARGCDYLTYKVIFFFCQIIGMNI